MTESWLHDGITDGLLDPNSLYNIIRCDRCGAKGGGVCVFVRKSFKVHTVQPRCMPKGVELVCFDLPEFSVVYRVFVVYRPPTSCSHGNSVMSSTDIMSQLINCLETNMLNDGVNLILGDFNCPNINWRNMSCSADTCHTTLYDFAVFNGLAQCVLMPTRSNSTLDLVFITDPMLVSNIKVDIPFSNSDHNVVDIDILYSQQSLQATRPLVKRFLWKHGDYSSMCDYLRTYNWNDIFVYNLTPDSLWQAFREVIDGAVELFVPHEYVSCDRSAKPSRRKYPKRIRELIARKRCLWRYHKRDPDNHTYADSYRDAAKECSKAITEYELSLEKQIVDAGSSGQFFRYINSKLGRSHNIGILKGKSGSNVLSDAEKANLLNSFFSSVNVTDNNVLPPFQPRVCENEKLDDIHFSPGTLVKISKKLKPKLTSGPDGYSPFFLKQIISAIAAPLCMVYQSFMSVGIIPSAWKSAIIVPIFKKGPSSDPSNYRPISLTSVFSKLMERCMVIEMLSYLLSRNLISKQQHGFLKRKSTTTNLLESFNDWSVNFEGRTSQTIAYIDFAKAFDSVCHSKLLHKLSQYGICGPLLNLIESFLSGRTHRTKVGDDLSDLAHITSGVVQGSCLGPILFVLFINDLPDAFTDAVTVKLYADDVKLYSAIKTSSLDTASDLQEQLDKLATWAETWQLPISYSKCCVLSLGKHNSGPSRLLTMNDYNILPVEQAVDLGVTVDREVKFSLHISNISRKAHNRANLIIRCFHSKNIPSLVAAYKVYVRPILEYSSVSWNPYLIKDIKSLENVQRRFTKRLPGMEKLTYHQRLSILELDSLELRRVRADLLFTYKLVFGLVDLSLPDFFVPRFNEARRGHGHKLYLPACKSNTRSNNFNYRVIQKWNSLPNSIDFTSLKRFNKSLAPEVLLPYCNVFFI